MPPAIVALLVTSLSVTVVMIVASGFGWRILRCWNINSGSEGQLTLERRTYLISTLLCYVVVAELLSLWLFVHTAESLSDQFVGAMCATGVLNVNRFGFPTLLLKIAIFFLGAAWLILNRVDNQADDYPLIRVKYGLLLIIAPLVWAEAIVQLCFFLGLNPNIITSCCGTLFSADAQGVGGELSGFKPMPMLLLFYGVAVMTLTSGWWFVRHRRGGVLFAVISLLAFAIAIAAIISFLSLYVYESPHHHCPFCLLKSGYDYVGYGLYLPLFIATAFGLGVGTITPFARIASLREVIRGDAQRFAVLALAGFSVFYAFASYLILRSPLILIEWH